MIGLPPLFYWQELLACWCCHYYGAHAVGQSTQVQYLGT